MLNARFRSLVKSLDKIYYGNQFPHIELIQPETSVFIGIKHILRLLANHKNNFLKSQ